MLTINWTERPSALQILNSKLFQNNTLLKNITIPIYSKTKTSAMNASKMNIDILSYGDKKPIKVFAKKPN